MVVVKDNKASEMPNLYLVGFMGVGKSAIGRKAAASLGLRFIDSDKAIEHACGKTIKEIFHSEGEAAFRGYERDFIEKGHPKSGCIVACGGGLVVSSGMKEKIKEKGIVICLFASVESILERTSRNSNRPLLNVGDPEKRIRELLAEREPIYIDSGICIHTDGRSFTEILQHVVRTYKNNASAFMKAH